MFKLVDVSKYYNSNGIVTIALEHINLEFKKGDIVAITGESGSGKSTLLNILCGNDSYDEGEIYFNGNETSYFDNNDLDNFRNKYVGFIYQNYNIIDSYTVLQNVMFPLLIKGIKYKEAKNRALELINKVKTTSFIYIGTSLNKFTNQYSLSKHQFSEYGKYYSYNKDINFFNIKLESFYGKDEPNDRFISYLINKLKNNEDINLTEGSQIRDFIYIDDVVNGIYTIIKSDLKGYHDIPLGSGDGISIRELVLYLKKKLNSKSKINFGIIPLRNNEHSGFADISEMEKLGFKIEFSIKDSILKYML